VPKNGGCHALSPLHGADFRDLLACLLCFALLALLMFFGWGRGSTLENWSFGNHDRQGARSLEVSKMMLKSLIQTVEAELFGFWRKQKEERSLKKRIAC